MGERVFQGKQKFDTLPFYEKYPNWSMVGKDIQDSMSAIDVLCTLDVVDQVVFQSQTQFVDRCIPDDSGRPEEQLVED
jgi:hypothetical protein